MTRSIDLELQRTVATAVQPTEHVLRVATMFGLGIDQHRRLAIIPPIRLTLRPGQVVFITGPSGSGKSTLLKLMAAALSERSDVCVTRFDDLPPLPDQPLVDCFEPWCGDLEQVLKILAYAGLNDAFVMLRKPSELSDGQRYRLRLAQTMAIAQAYDNTQAKGGDPPPRRDAPTLLHVVLADEFGATLDRTTAHVIARNVRKWTRRASRHGLGLCFIAATTHDDLLEPLEPDVLIEKPLGEDLHVLTREP